MEIRKTKKIALQLTIVVATVLFGFTVLRSVQAVAGLSAASPNIAAALTGAIYTSTAVGTTVNANLYEQCDEVYLNGGPQNQNGGGLPPGTYYFQVTNPNGDVLLSTDNAVCRQLTVNASGAIAGATGPCPHTNGITNPANGNTPVQLYPFNATPNMGSEYKVWLIPVGAATVDPDLKHLIFSNNDSKTDNFKSKACPNPTMPAIGGIKYNDVDANGVYDPGKDTGIQGVTISVTIGNNPPITTQTDKDGMWALVLPAGTQYTACEVLDPSYNYTQTGPKDGAIANDVSNNPAASAQGNCWVGTVKNVDTKILNFYNVVCKINISCPADTSIECGKDTSPANTGSATATSNCGVKTPLDFKDSFAPGCGSTGVLTRTWTATDNFGHTESCTQKITIVDTTKPTISGVGGPLTIECPMAPVFSAPTASDNCSIPTLTSSDVTTPSACAGTYSITRTWTATDACNNSSNASQTITVVDKTSPTFTKDAGASGFIYCPTTPVFTPPTATDSCSTATVFVFSDKTDYGTCGTYSRTITWAAKDDCGNISKDTRSQTIEVRCNSCGEGTIGFWQNKNGQDLIKSANQASLATYLNGYKPFQDLGAQVIATYVTNIVKSASAAGASMNPMLKAQMLSTALDVYFNKVNGAANIDLTYINKPIGSTTYENVSSSFGGASCMSVKNMLLYAANQSNVGGTVWYGQVKSGPNSQELAKDAFDAINNQKAFSVFSCQ